MLSSFTLAFNHVVTTFINFSPFAFHSYSPLIKWMFISSYPNALGHLVCFTPLFTPSRVSSFHCSFHHFIVHFKICQCTWPFYCILHSYLTLLGFHHFITYILGSLTFKRMLDLWVYTYKPWGFIHSSFNWFISSYDFVVQYLCILYIFQDLGFDLRREYYFRTFNSRMTYVSISNLGKGTRFRIPWM